MLLDKPKHQPSYPWHTIRLEEGVVGDGTGVDGLGR